VHRKDGRAGRFSGGGGALINNFSFILLPGFFARQGIMSLFPVYASFSFPVLPAIVPQWRTIPLLSSHIIGFFLYKSQLGPRQAILTQI